MEWFLNCKEGFHWMASDAEYSKTNPDDKRNQSICC